MVNMEIAIIDWFWPLKMQSTASDYLLFRKQDEILFVLTFANYINYKHFVERDNKYLRLWLLLNR